MEVMECVIQVVQLAPPFQDFNMLNNNQEQNEFNDSLYQDDNKKIIKIIVVVLAVLLVAAGLVFAVLRKKAEPVNTQIENTNLYEFILMI